MQVACARRDANSRVSGLSTEGFVSGRATNVVTPPAAAANPAERKLSLWRSPGSQTLAPISTIPGARYWPSASNNVSAVSAPEIWPLLIVREPNVTV